MQAKTETSEVRLDVSAVAGSAAGEEPVVLATDALTALAEKFNLAAVGAFGSAFPDFPYIYATAPITIWFGGSAIIEPTPSWVCIYPTPEPEAPMDALEDPDIAFKPKKRRVVTGTVVARRRATFKTAFADEMDTD